MKIEPELRIRLASVFEPLKQMASGSLPARGFLAKQLENALATSAGPVSVSAPVVRAFASASIEMWLRGVHTFVISCTLTEASPIWASVTGYYASHYVMRAFAHTLGHFLLFRLKKVARLQFAGGSYGCTVDPKTVRDREHVFYWRVVKDDRQFSVDPLFRRNVFDGDVSDAGHREHANYADHIDRFPNLATIQVDDIKDRIRRISQIPFDDPPIPRLQQFPAVESVQIVAYHRLVRFRQLLDEALEGKNRFWNVHREPPWVRDLMDFQLTEQGGLRSARN